MHYYTAFLTININYLLSFGSCRKLVISMKDKNFSILDVRTNILVKLYFFNQCLKYKLF